MEYGYSRVILGAHWQSDVDNSRMAASLLFSVLQTNEEFQAMMKEAQEEYREKTGSAVTGIRSVDDGRASDGNALIYTIDGRLANDSARGIVISEGQKRIAQ
jgi:hypothetical protein